MRFFRVFLPAGFTLVEMMIVLAIVAILLGIGMPSFNESMRDKRLSSMTSEFISSVYIARNESLVRRKSVQLDPLVTGWQTGWIIREGTNVLHRYINPNAEPGGSESDMRVAVWNTANVPLAAGRFVFTPNGKVQFTGGTIGGVNVLICDDRPRERGRTLAVSAFGTVQNTPHATSEACEQVGN